VLLAHELVEGTWTHPHSQRARRVRAVGEASAGWRSGDYLEESVGVHSLTLTTSAAGALSR
jgi:hypothetical protein